MASTRLAISPQTYASDDVFVHQLAVLSTRRTLGLPSDLPSQERPCHSLIVDISCNNCKVTKNGDFPTEDSHLGGDPLISLCPCWAYQKRYTGCCAPVSSTLGNALMNNAVIGKIAKFINGLPHFAEVELTIVDGTGTVVCRCSGNGWRSQGMIEDALENGYEDWKESASEGVKMGFKMTNIEMNDKSVIITRISGLDGTDTNPDMVKCAAIVAVWNLLGYTATSKDNDFVTETLRSSWGKFRIS